MSMPNIPDITPDINLDFDDSLKLLLNSIALQEMGLSHIVNAEGEKIQHALGIIDKKAESTGECDGCSILMINDSVRSTLRDVMKNQMMLQMRLEDAIGFYNSINGGNHGGCCGGQGGISICNSNINKQWKKCFNLDYEDDNEEYSEEDGIDCMPIYF